MFAHDVKEAVIVLTVDDQLNDRYQGTLTILLISPCQRLLKQTSHRAAHSGVLQTTFHSGPASFLLMLSHSSCLTHGPSMSLPGLAQYKARYCILIRNTSVPQT